MKFINWGIIGCGDVAEIKSGPAFQRIEHSNLVIVMRRDEAKAKDFAKRHNVPNFSSDAEDILNNEQIDAVYIATPPSTHLEYALKALDAGKLVYLEKPMALDAVEAKQICDAVTKSSGKLTVAHYRRKLPAFLKVKELLDEQVIGNITHVDIQILQPKVADLIAASEENWRLNPQVSGGGYFYDLAPHQIDLMIHYFGPIAAATGFSKQSKNTSKVEEVVNGILSFKSGVQFRGVWNFNVANKSKKDECIIYGTEGTIKFSFFGDSVFLTTENGIETFAFENPKHVQEPMIKATVDYFLNKAENPCPVEDGVLVMELLEKLSGRTV
ncbi:Gfo/Idh/MocA family protein [Maribacter sp. MAR_2009_72]|uniref:Gfo/Idh/MocA family protein n=1 Tax=Maribacter sp. MAR_2009_72 TaxID=1250050 RepID=UPI001198DFF6|nr:Gfo/Idh/MocA family oxidoreductase [Maribacter sp. MAR_2009_72]TVZ16573.1 putative dehydrogenase [Maribacter sp. MAR_2009_72]